MSQVNLKQRHTVSEARLPANHYTREHSLETGHDSTTDNVYGTKSSCILAPNSRFDVTRSQDASGYKTVDATRTSIKAQSVDLSKSAIGQNKHKVPRRYFDENAYRPKDFLKVYSKDRAESQWLDLL
jgi:hypothetical protein